MGEGEGRGGDQGGRLVNLDKRGPGGNVRGDIVLHTGGPRKACRGRGVGV